MNKPTRIILVTGGQRSGKSELAEKLALDSSPTPIYIATCQPLDEEMKRRVAIHKARREGHGWSTIELLSLADAGALEGATVLIDSVTMLASNAFFACEENETVAIESLKDDLDNFLKTSLAATLIFVTDEIGLGGVSGSPITRRFTDLLGMFNRYIAERADEVFLTVSGIPLKIK